MYNIDTIFGFLYFCRTAELPSAPKISNAFGPDPQGSDSGEEASLPARKPG